MAGDDVRHGLLVESTERSTMEHTERMRDDDRGMEILATTSGWERGRSIAPGVPAGLKPSGRFRMVKNVL
jgi:hypothetical protein